MFYSIRIYDPLEERNQIFSIMSDAAKQYWTNYSNITGKQYKMNL